MAIVQDRHENRTESAKKQKEPLELIDRLRRTPVAAIATSVFAISSLGLALPADATLITNGSFETGDLTGWTATGSINGNCSLGEGSDGDCWAEFNGANQTPNGVLSQVLSVTNGQSYTLSFDFGKFAFGSGTASLLVSVDGIGTLLSQTVSDASGTTGSGLFETFQFNFVADSSTATLSFTDTSTNSGSAFDPFLDNVEVVPEPSTALLLGGGLLGLAARRRRRKA